MFVLTPMPQCLDYRSYVVSFEIIFVIFQDFLTILGLLPFHMNFRISVSIYVTKPSGILIDIALNL